MTKIRTEFQTRPDGEHALCRSCQRAGYGEDSWHPATSDFWYVEQGRIRFNQCRACKTEQMSKTFGMVVVDIQDRIRRVSIREKLIA